MRTSILFLTLFIVSSCATQKEIARKSIYSFNFEGEQFQITSINTDSGEGFNFLSQIDNSGKTEFKARDFNQDGTLDIVLKGNLTLTKANEIYLAGINFARAEGNYKETTSLRTFEFSKAENLYTIKTYILDEDNASNLFSIYNHLTGELSLFSDSNANGVLNTREKGNMSIEDANRLYKEIIEEGILSKRMVKKETTYIVIESSNLQTASYRKEH